MAVARQWRLKAQRYRLVGEECPACKHKLFPPRDVCPHCAAPGRGSVFSYPTVHGAAAGYQARAPHIVAVVELAEGPQAAAQLTEVDRDQFPIGLAVEMVTRVLHSNGPRGAVEYGYKFRPVLEWNVSEQLTGLTLANAPPAGLAA